MSQERNQARIFVVDDESVITTTLGTILELHGYEAHPFDQPLEALRASREMAPDLLLSDVVMPVLTGIELAVQIREHCPKCKVLLFSGQPAITELLAKAHAEGHRFESLLKPVHPAELLEKIRTVMDA